MFCVWKKSKKKKKLCIFCAGSHWVRKNWNQFKIKSSKLIKSRGFHQNGTKGTEYLHDGLQISWYVRTMTMTSCRDEKKISFSRIFWLACVALAYNTFRNRWPIRIPFELQSNWKFKMKTIATLWKENFHHQWPLHSSSVCLIQTLCHTFKHTHTHTVTITLTFEIRPSSNVKYYFEQKKRSTERGRAIDRMFKLT